MILLNTCSYCFVAFPCIDATRIYITGMHIWRIHSFNWDCPCCCGNVTTTNNRVIAWAISSRIFTSSVTGHIAISHCVFSGFALFSPATGLAKGSCQSGSWHLSSSETPSKTISFFYLSTCPTGWIPANGLNGTPDLRGEFIRGWDNGRGVDDYRALGSWQPQAIQSHSHTFTATQYDGANGVHGYVSTDNANGNFTLTTGSTGGDETRPRNIALLACMKK